MSNRKAKGLRIFLLALVPLAFGAFYAVARGASKGPQSSGADDQGFAEWRGQPDAPFTDGEASFHKILKILHEKYVDDGISDDEFYRAAAQGLLEHADAKRAAWNRLMTPTEYAELNSDMNGEIVGVGLDFRFEETSGMGVVNEAIPGTPAAAAGLQPADRILKVDGRAFAGLQMRDMVYAIRGKSGTHVKLTMLRDAAVFESDLVRTKVGFEEAEVGALPDGVTYVRIRSFTRHTAEKVEKGLKSLPQDEVTGVLVDVRGCQGGSFDAAVQTTSLFVPKGNAIVRVKHRGGAEETLVAEKERQTPDVPAEVLIDHDTASGCELIAAALKQNLGANLIGEQTFGKWSIQSVDELANKYAVKYSVASFYPPDGTDYSGKGLPPDVPVAVDAGLARKLDRAPLATRLAQDPQLIAAHALLTKGE